jgi:hypothetical protein
MQTKDYKIEISIRAETARSQNKVENGQLRVDLGKWLENVPNNFTEIGIRIIPKDGGDWSPSF